MGYYICKLKDLQLNEYIGSQTIYSCADKGAFSSEVNEDLNKYADNHENVMAIVDEAGVPHFLETLRTKSVAGRDVQMLIETVEKKYQSGFMIVG